MTLESPDAIHAAVSEAMRSDVATTILTDAMSLEVTPASAGAALSVTVGGDSHDATTFFRYITAVRWDRPEAMRSVRVAKSGTFVRLSVVLPNTERTAIDEAINLLKALVAGSAPPYSARRQPSQ